MASKRQRTTGASGFRTEDGRHIYLNFGPSDGLMRQRMEGLRESMGSLITRPIEVPRTVDWEFLKSRQADEEIKSYLIKEVKDDEDDISFTCKAWERVFDI